MLYKIHFYYRKRNSRKSENKCEVLVFAKDERLARKLVENMILDFAINPEPFSIINLGYGKSLEEIYNGRPELQRILPEEGYIYNEFSHRAAIQRYLK